MSKKTTAAKNTTSAGQLAAHILTATALLLVALGLYGCDGNSPTSATPGPSPTIVTSVALPTDIVSDSPPSASWEDLLAAAQAKVASVYTDAIASAVSASPYDFDLNAYYQPKSDILRVGFSFITPAVNIIRVNMADDSPTTTVQMSSDDYTKDSDFNELFTEQYSDTVKVEPTITKAMSVIKITPRQAVQLTQKEAIDHAHQIGLGTETLIPEVSLDSLNASGPQWKVSYKLNPIDENGRLTPKEPVATFELDAQVGQITSRTYQDAQDPLAATPGMTATMQAAITALVPTALAQETQHPETSSQQYVDSGKMAELNGQTDQALEDYSRAIELDPNNTDAYMARARIYQDKNELSQVIADCTKIIEIKPRYEAYTARGAAYIHIGDADAAKRQPDLALQDFNAAIQLEPDKAEPYSYQALAYYWKGDYDNAIASNTEAIKRDAKYAEAYFSRGEAYQAKQEYDQAISDYDGYIKLRPTTSWAYRQRADAYAYKGDPAHAILDYTEAIRLQPNYRDAFYRRGYAYEALYDYDHAMQDFNKVIELDPKYPFGHEGLGTVYYATGKYSEAITEFDAALSLTSPNAAIYEERGRADLRSDKLQESMDDFNKSIGLYPAGNIAYVGRGRVYMAMHEYDKAIADFTTSTEKYANYSWPYQYRAIAYAYKGDFTAAFADIDQAIKVGGDDDGSYFARGKVYALQGEKDKAIADLNKALESTKDLNLKKDIENELQALQNK